MYLDKLFLSRDIQPNLKDSLDVILVLIKDETSQTLPDKFPFQEDITLKQLRI